MDLVYSKRQIAPIIKKYNIDVENDAVFKAIISIFNGQTDYQIWGLKCVYDNVITLEKLQSLKKWATENQTDIHHLSKGNLVGYKTAEDFKKLEEEKSLIKNYHLVYDVVSKFNTDQRNELRKHIGLTNTNIVEVARRKIFIYWFNVFSKFVKIPQSRQEKVINLASAIRDDMQLMYKHINDSLAKAYDWNRDDMLAYMENNCPDCGVIYDKDNIVIISVPSFKSSKTMCGSGRTQWCLTREERYYNNYVKTDNGNRIQYFLFNFNFKEDNDFAHIGFTVDPNQGIINAHSTRNNNLMSRITWSDGDNAAYNVHDLFNKWGIPSSVYIRLKKLVLYEWAKESFMRWVIDGNRKDIAFVVENENKLVVNVQSAKALDEIVSHTFINVGNCRFNSDRTYFVYFDFGIDYCDNNSLYLFEYTKDKWGTMTISKVLDPFKKEISKSTVFEKIGMPEKDIISQVKIDPHILLHKYIEERNETAAIKLIAENGDDFDVNYQFYATTPVFSAIDNRMNKLFKKIVSHPKFNSHAMCVFDVTTLEYLILSYKFYYDPTFVTNSNASAEHENKIEDMIRFILASNNYDFNHCNISNDSAINIACEREYCNWIVKALVDKPEVNLNIVNDINLTSLGQAITNGNKEAVEILLKREDLLIRDSDFELAKENGIDLEGMMEKAKRKKSFSVSVDEAEPSVDEKSKLFRKLLESMTLPKVASKSK